MPINSNYTINNFSPGFRDALLSRNLLADTVQNNSVSSWLQDINKPADIGDGVGMVKGSPDIEVEGPVYRVDNTRFNKINSSEYYTNFNIVNVSRDIFLNLGGRDPLIASPTTDGPYWRDTQNTIFNPFKLGDNQYYGNTPVVYTDTNITTNTVLVDTGSRNNPEDDGVFRRELSVTQNRYRSTNYERIDIQQLPWEVNSALLSLNLTPNEYGPLQTFLETYTENGVRLPLSINTVGNVRDFNTTKNIYLDVAKQTRIDLRTEPQVAPGKQLTSYLDNFNNIKVGGASTQVVDVLGSVLTGGGVGFDPNSGNPVPDFDVRSSLLGRGLSAAGVINDTRLGQISAGYLAAAIGNNIAFNLQEETIGRINTNPLSLAMGGDIIVPNYKITVGEGGLGVAGDILERLTGAKIPVSPLPEGADIFSYDKKGYIGIANIDRANNLLANTGKGTVQALFGNVNSSINPNLIGNRSGYAPQYFDGDKTTDPSIIYAFSNGEGGVIDLLSRSNENAPIAQSSHNLSGIISNSGFKGDPGKGSFLLVRPKDDSPSFLTSFVWSDKRWNKLVEDLNDSGIDNTTRFSGTKRSLLNRTQELFNSGKMRTLTGGKGIQVNQDETTTTTGPNGAFMSKGSGVLVGGGVNLNSKQAPEEIFARAWSPVDRYDQYKDLQKHSRLSKDARTDQSVNVEDSVLEDHGIVKIGPYPDDTINKFMFSIENLAWHDYTNDLPGCEIGEGDLLTGRKGRVMWFPPYDITFNESVSTSWDRSNFIGRGEPVYTYNNTERTGNLSWKIIIDHPNYLNYMKGRSDDEIAAFFAGALEIEEIRNRILSENEKAKLDVKKAQEASSVKENIDNNDLPKIEFNIYFPNDVAELPDTTGYEDGLDDSGRDIDYSLNPTGEGFGNGTTIGEGIVGGAGRVYNDNTNFGLNNSTVVVIDDPVIFNWSDPVRIEKELSAMLDIEGGPYLYSKITLIGYASQQGDADKNEVLARTRANKVKEWMVNNLLLGYSDDEINKRFKIKSEVITNSSCVAGVSQDAKECKQDRKVTVRIEYDASLKPQKVTQTDPSEPVSTLSIPISRYYTECSYFERVAEDTENFAIQQIRDKIKNFHPAFHSITPEGFNSRLTFLHQCTRQGPTKNDDGKTPDNLAFGRAPVCILRIGDFYNTKIIIESLTIDYEPLVWDINPEGVGVQPMIANVNIGFAFIGGSSLKGPINRLQNAVSFNFFANTELYDPRADRFKRKNGTVTLENGVPVTENKPDSDKKKAPTGVNNTKVTSQEAEAEVEATTPANTAQEQPEEINSLRNDKELIASTKLRGYRAEESLKEFLVQIEVDPQSFGDGGVTGTGLIEEYLGEVFINNSLTNETYVIGYISALPDTETTFELRAQDQYESSAIVSIEEDPYGTLYRIVLDLEGNPDFDKIFSLLNTSCRVFTSEGSKPCPDGDHTIILKWTDIANNELISSNRMNYTKANQTT